MTRYPDRFYIVHAYFADIHGGCWGDIADGPASTLSDAEHAALEHFAKCPEYQPAGHHNLRVTLVQPSISRAWDETAGVLEFLDHADIPVSDSFLEAAE